jgi:hypothetical protein
VASGRRHVTPAGTRWVKAAIVISSVPVLDRRDLRSCAVGDWVTVPVPEPLLAAETGD